MSLPTNQISSIIGSGGGDYLTLTAWEADLDDAVFDQDYIAEITGTTADTTVIYFAGVNTTSAYKAIIRPALGQEPNGTDNYGAVVNHTINIQYNTNICNIDISTEFNDGGVIISSLHADSEINIIKSVLRDCSAGCIGIDISPGCAGTVNIGSCLIRNFAYVPIWQRSASASVKLINTTVYGNNYGVYWSNAFVEIKNTVSMNNTSADFKTTIANATYCCDEDSSLPTATGNIEGAIVSNQWTDPVNDDFTVQDVDADIYHSGITISDTWFPSTDLVGTAWNNPPSMGCFEFLDSGQLSTNLLDGKLIILNKAINLLDGKLNIKDISTNLLDGMVSVKSSHSDLLDGKISIKDVALNTLDGKIILKDSSVSSLDGIISIKNISSDFLDGKVILKSSNTTNIDGKIVIKSSSVGYLDGKIILSNITIGVLDGIITVEDASTINLDGKIQIKDSSTNLLDGLINIIAGTTNLLDGKINVESVGTSTNILDGSITVKDVATNYLDGLIIIQNKSTTDLDCKLIIKNTSELNLDGKVTVKDLSQNLLDGKLSIQSQALNLLDGKLDLISANINLLDGKVIFRDDTSVILDGKISIESGEVIQFIDGKITITELAHGKVKVYFSMVTPSISFELKTPNISFEIE